MRIPPPRPNQVGSDAPGTWTPLPGLKTVINPAALRLPRTAELAAEKASREHHRDRDQVVAHDDESDV
jgi:hypothetical protein